MIADAGTGCFWPLLALGALLLGDLFFGHGFFNRPHAGRPPLRQPDRHPALRRAADAGRARHDAGDRHRRHRPVGRRGRRDLRRARLPADQPARRPEQRRRRAASRSPRRSGCRLVLGLWNGLLVAVIGIQPIIATLILMVGGPRHRAADHRRARSSRSTARPYKLDRRRLLARRCRSRSSSRPAMFAARPRCSPAGPRSGMLIESVGGNAEASRLAGVRSRAADHRSPTCSAALCAGIAGLMVSSNDQQRRRQQRRALDRARRHPRRGHRRHLADRRPVLPRRHASSAR